MKIFFKYIFLSALFTALIIFENPVLAGEGRLRISDLKNDFSNEAAIDAEIRFGRELSARILGNYPLLDNADANRYVNMVGKSISLYAGGHISQYHFGILDSEEVNAFAAPGGYIFITAGALKKMENEAQLAAVLAHEIGHIIKRHVIKALEIRNDRGSAVAGVAALIGGTTGGVRSTFGKALNRAEEILFKNGYMAEDEFEADKTGIIICALAGYDSNALKTFLIKAGRFEKSGHVSGAEHPVFKSRIKKINAVLSENGLQNISGKKVRGRFYDYIQKNNM